MVKSRWSRLQLETTAEHHGCSGRCRSTSLNDVRPYCLLPPARADLPEPDPPLPDVFMLVRPELPLRSFADPPRSLPPRADWPPRWLLPLRAEALPPDLLSAPSRLLTLRRSPRTETLLRLRSRSTNRVLD